MSRYRSLTTLGLIGAALVLDSSAQVANAQCDANETMLRRPSDAAALQFYGEAVAMSGATMIVGTPQDFSTGVLCGSIYVLEHDGETWTELQEIHPADGANYDEFGSSVAIDGDRAIAGSPGEDAPGDSSGAAYFFRRDGSSWVNDGKVEAGDRADGDEFGTSVAIFGPYAVIGAPNDDDAGSNSGSAHVYEHDGSSWQFLRKLAAPDAAADDRFGRSVTIRGDTIVVGAPGRDAGARRAVGVAYVFQRDEGGPNHWGHRVTVAPFDRPLNLSDLNFGHAVSVGEEVLAVGAPRERSAGINDHGAVFTFRRNAGGADNWGPDTRLVAADAAEYDNLGYSVAVAEPALVVGAPGADGAIGKGYVFRDDGTGWNEEARLLASDGAPDDYFGRAAAASGTIAALGAPYDTHPQGVDAGTVYVFGGISDCNANTYLDLCDIAEGRSDDDNGDGVPDECEVIPCPADMNEDRVVNIFDLLLVLAHWGPCPMPCPPYCLGDANEDCTVNVLDLLEVLANWGPCP